VIPYKVNALANSLSPLKLKEYLATGKPVIASNIAAAVEYKDYVSVAATRADWLTCIDQALGAKTPLKKLNLDQESWREKANLLVRACA
jgi:hypothetical protein